MSQLPDNSFLHLAAGCHLAQVVDVHDPDNLARVKVRLLAQDPDGAAEIWARVAVPFAGADRGALLIPDVGDEVLLSFIGGDSRFPVVLGGLWNGSASPPDEVSGSSNRVERWLFQGRNGTRIAIVEDTPGMGTIKLETPGGVTATLQDGPGSLTLEDGNGNSVKLETTGITIQSSAKVKVQASQVEVSAGMVKVDAGMSIFSGVVKCDVLQATTVVAATYTPGAGNIW